MIIELITLKTYILLKFTFAEQMHLNIHFFPIPFLNGTNLTQTCAMLNHTHIQKITTEDWSVKPKSYLQNPLSFRSKTPNKAQTWFKSP